MYIKLRIARHKPRKSVREPHARPWLRRVLLAALALAAAAALTAAHVFYWYVPRLRPGEPRPGRLPARLLASEQFPAAVWMPYPHQNLGLLEDAVAAADGDADLPAALARLAGLPEPSLPSFGPLRVPPATEIAFASDDEGRHFALVADVYPAAAAFAKLAGRLAGNRWLEGGELTVEGRRVEVAWHGRVWTVTSAVGAPDGLPPLEDAPAAPGEPSLLIAEVRQATHPLPPGRFRLTKRGPDLVLASDGAGAGPPIRTPELSELGLFLLVLSGRNETLGEPLQAMAFFAHEAPGAISRQGGTYDFPGVASIYETGGEPWSLPGENLFEWKMRRAELGAWNIAALDAKSFEAIRQLAPRLAPLAQPGRDGHLAWGLWLDLETGLAEVSEIADALEDFPLASPRRRQRWRDAATVLTPAARTFSRLSVVVTTRPPALHLRLSGR